MALDAQVDTARRQLTARQQQMGTAQSAAATAPGEEAAVRVPHGANPDEAGLHEPGVNSSTNA